MQVAITKALSSESIIQHMGKGLGVPVHISTNFDPKWQFYVTNVYYQFFQAEILFEHEN